MANNSQQTSQSIVVLGGGIGGVATANRLRRRLDRRHRVILVNRDQDFTFAASFLWVMSGKRKPSQVTHSLKSLEKKGIEVVIGNIEVIDPESRTITVDGKQIHADYMVVSLGIDYALDSVPGLKEAGETFATLDGAQKLSPAIKSFTKGKVLIVTAAPMYRCPAAPYESAFLIDEIIRTNKVRGHVEISIHSAEPGPMAVAGANVSQAVISLLADREINYQPSHQITSATKGTADFADGKSEAFDMLVYMPPIGLPTVLASSSLVGPSGWIEADRNTLSTSFPNVYAIGDNTQLPLSIGKPLPRAGVFAHAQALVVADNISASINGKDSTSSFDGHGGCFIETGFGKAGYGSGNFFAEPSPSVKIRQPSRRFHLSKVAFEFNVMKRWL